MQSKERYERMSQFRYGIKGLVYPRRTRWNDSQQRRCMDPGAFPTQSTVKANLPIQVTERNHSFVSHSPSAALPYRLMIDGGIARSSQTVHMITRFSANPLQTATRAWELLDHETAHCQLRTMERITARADNDFSVYFYSSLWVAALSFIWFFCRADPEDPVKYAVEPPEQAEPGWKGEVLERPSLKASHVLSVVGMSA